MTDVTFKHIGFDEFSILLAPGDLGANKLCVPIEALTSVKRFKSAIVELLT